MGFSLFGSPRKITPQEFKRDIRTELSRKLSHSDIDHVASISDGSLFETGKYRGIDRREKDQIIDTLRTKRDAHRLTDSQIRFVDEVLSKEFK